MNICGYCGNTSFSPFVAGVTDRLGVVDGEYSFVKCAECGSGWLDPLPSPDRISAFYPRMYGLGKGADERPLMSAVELALWFGPVYRRNARLLEQRVGRDKSVLDVGCGSGYQAACFKRRGFNVTGIDFAEGTREWMDRQHGIEAYSCGVNEMPVALSDRKFDVITAFHVVEHMLDPNEFLSGLISRLNPNGAIFMSMPLADSLQARAFGRKWGAFREAPRHVSLPSKKGISVLFEKHGLNDVRVRPDHIYYVAGSAFASLLSSLSMTTSYGKNKGLSLVMRRLFGAALAACYLPVACCEVMGRNYSMGLAFGRRS